MRERIDRIFDPETDLRQRLFQLLSSIALTEYILVTGYTIVSGGDAEHIIVMTSGMICFALCVINSFKLDMVREGAALSALLYFILYPVTFFDSGGMYGGAPVVFAFALVYVFLVTQGRERVFLMTLCLAATAVCYVLSCVRPELLVRHTVIAEHVESFFAIVLTTLLLCSLFAFVTRVHNTENRIVREQKKEIENLNKAQKHFFSSMSHEIRTPVNAIIGFNEMTMREDVSEEVLENSRNIEAAGRILLHTINEILDMSRLETGSLEIRCSAYRMADMLSEIVSMIWLAADRKGLEFTVEADPELPEALCGDEVRIKQILLNVLTNAVKYTRKGSVKLSIGGRTEENIKAAAGTEGNRGAADTAAAAGSEGNRAAGDGAAANAGYRLICDVSDTGMGIKEEDIPYLFTAFTRADEENTHHIEGTGLGLSIVSQLLEMMNGSISVTSEYGKGSVFHIEIPQKTAELPAAAGFRRSDALPSETEDAGEGRSPAQNRDERSGSRIGGQISNKETEARKQGSGNGTIARKQGSGNGTGAGVQESNNGTGAGVQKSGNGTGAGRQAPDLSALRVLAVDDTPMNLMVVKKLLRDTGVTLDTADSGFDALQMTLDTHYDLILMDHQMPGMDGVECLHRIRDQQDGKCRGSRIVCLTAGAGSDMEKMFLEEGFDGYLMKPVRGKTLEDELAALI